MWRVQATEHFLEPGSMFSWRDSGDNAINQVNTLTPRMPSVVETYFAQLQFQNGACEQHTIT